MFFYCHAEARERARERRLIGTRRGITRSAAEEWRQDDSCWTLAENNADLSDAQLGGWFAF